MKVRFQADNDLSNHIRRGLIKLERSIDFRSAQDAGLDHLPDPTVLGLAAADERMLVTHDEHTMPLHFHDRLRRGYRSPSLAIVPQDKPIAAAIDSLLLLWAASEAEEWRDRLIWLPL